jgi:N-methylhydantoinase A
VGIRVGIDTGGTFTDLVAVDESSGDWYVAKVPSTPERPVDALAAIIEQAHFDPSDVSFIVVGTTIGINAVLTRTGARVVYLTTKGFEDVPHIQRINRKHHYDFAWRKPAPLALRQDCIGVDERINAEGEIVRPLRAEEIRELLPDRGDEDLAVAVSFLFSYLNPQTELDAREAIAAVDPDLPVSLSHEIAPIWREYERGTAAILDAYLKPTFDRYVAGVTSAFGEQGVGSSWSLLKSNGGHTISTEARERPAHVLLSGIAGGAIGGAHFARARDAPRGIVLDMGGTSCDVCLIVDGDPMFSSEFEIEFGLPVAVPTVSTKTIGAGGGSIGWVDPGGFLQVGPQSAGAEPGPACYSRGGEEPTLTDANLTLGRLNPDYFLGGALKLDEQAGRAALTRLSERLGQDEVEVASSMIRVANENMANAVRIVTVEQGVDPRDHALIAMGGAGPTHAAEIAEAIGIDRVIVPLHPGLTSAFGALAAEVRVDEVKSIALKSTALDLGELQALLDDLADTATANFRVQGAPDATPAITRTISMRYEGQNYEQEIPVPEGELDEQALGSIYHRYHDLHEEFYGYRLDGLPIELVRLTATVTAAEPAGIPELSLDTRGGAGEVEPPGSRTVKAYFGDGFQDTPVVPRAELVGAEPRQGPLIVESMDTTLVVPPGWTAHSDAVGILQLSYEGGDASAGAPAKAAVATDPSGTAVAEGREETP